jgi:pSer/pThr/pTyr-binding forkhead associated (FHA) protein
LGKAINVLGRSPECDVVVSDPSISRRHAELHLVESELHIKDLESRNGTFAADVRIQKCQLRLGEIIRFFAASNLH